MSFRYVVFPKDGLIHRIRSVATIYVPDLRVSGTTVCGRSYGTAAGCTRTVYREYTTYPPPGHERCEECAQEIKNYG